MKLERIQDAFKRYGVSRSTGYVMIDDGLFPKPVQICKRSSAIPDFELDHLIQARIAGFSDDDIRILVLKLHSERQQAVCGDVI